MSQSLQGCEQEIGTRFNNVIRLGSDLKHHYQPIMSPITTYLINYFDNHPHAVKVPAFTVKHKIFDHCYYLDLLHEIYTIIGPKTIPELNKENIEQFIGIYELLHTQNKTLQQKQGFDKVINTFAASIKMDYEIKCTEKISKRVRYQNTLMYGNGIKAIRNVIKSGLLLDAEPELLIPNRFKALNQTIVALSSKSNYLYLTFAYTQIKCSYTNNAEYKITPAQNILDVQYSALKTNETSQWNKKQEDIAINANEPIKITLGKYELNQSLFEWKGESLDELKLRRKEAHLQYKITRKICKKIVKKQDQQRKALFTAWRTFTRFSKDWSSDDETPAKEYEAQRAKAYNMWIQFEDIYSTDDDVIMNSRESIEHRQNAFTKFLESKK